jgi:hypothetical protein
MTVPEAGDDYFAGTIDLLCRSWNLQLGASSHRSNPAMLYEHHCVIDRFGGRRRINLRPLQH